MKQPVEKLVMKVTICPIANRELYAALLRMRTPRSRASFLKALSRDGLRAESDSLRLADNTADPRIPVAVEPEQLPTIQEMLNWSDE